MPAERPKQYSVSEACAFAKGLLQRHTLRIVGEVSELTDKRGYKAVYFTIKDEGATLSCMMWRNRYAAADVPLDLGAKVIVEGSFSVYAPRGDMQFEVKALSMEGEGELRARVARLAKKLQEEGLMDPARRRPLVQFPDRVGLVTSPNGAVVHDVLRTLRNRFPGVEVLFAGVQVEGANAASDMICALRTVIEAGAEEVLLVRGGGSYESMMPFNDEALCRFIAASPVPVITGIGHEPDTTLADLVCDCRTSTPTYAAAAIYPNREEIHGALDSLEGRMSSYVTHRLRRCVDYLEARVSRPSFKDPLSAFATEMQMIDQAQATLERGLGAVVARESDRLDALQQRLYRAIPASQAQAHSQIDMLEARLGATATRRFDAYESQLAAQTANLRHAGGNVLAPFANEAALATSRLQDLSPLRTLERGWSIVAASDGTVVSSVEQVNPGDTISVQMVDGRIEASVTATQHDEDMHDSIRWKD